MAVLRLAEQHLRLGAQQGLVGAGGELRVGRGGAEGDDALGRPVPGLEEGREARPGGRGHLGHALAAVGRLEVLAGGVAGLGHHGAGGGEDRIRGLREGEQGVAHGHAGRLQVGLVLVLEEVDVLDVDGLVARDLLEHRTGLGFTDRVHGRATSCVGGMWTKRTLLCRSSSKLCEAGRARPRGGGRRRGEWSPVARSW